MLTQIRSLFNLHAIVTELPVGNNDMEPRPRKRIRADSATDPPKIVHKDPRIFVPFRALGLITNHVPFVLQTRSHKGSTDGPQIVILTCLGKAWAMWEGGKMGLLFVSALGSL